MKCIKNINVSHKMDNKRIEGGILSRVISFLYNTS